MLLRDLRTCKTQTLEPMLRDVIEPNAPKGTGVAPKQVPTLNVGKYIVACDVSAVGATQVNNSPLKNRNKVSGKGKGAASGGAHKLSQLGLKPKPEELLINPRTGEVYQSQQFMQRLIRQYAEMAPQVKETLVCGGVESLMDSDTESETDRDSDSLPGKRTKLNSRDDRGGKRDEALEDHNFWGSRTFEKAEATPKHPPAGMMKPIYAKHQGRESNPEAPPSGSPAGQGAIPRTNPSGLNTTSRKRRQDDYAWPTFLENTESFQSLYKRACIQGEKFPHNIG